MTQSKRDLTVQSFERFLTRLDTNRERAGEAYEELRLMLVKFFEWRRALYPDELADETINRVIRKLDVEVNGETKQIQNLTSYSYGVARLVFLESLKSPANRQDELTDLHDRGTTPIREELTDESIEDINRLQCFRDCFRTLPGKMRSLLEQYYRDEKHARIDHRKEMAQQLSLTPAALRRRAKLARDKLEGCVRRCLKRHEWAGK